MSAVTYVGVDWTIGGYASYTAYKTAPAGTAAGDFIIVYMVHPSSTYDTWSSITSQPAGYTQLFDNAGGTCWTRVATGTSADNFSCTFQYGEYYHLIIATFRNTTGIDQWFFGTWETGVLFWCPSLTATNTNDMYVLLMRAGAVDPCTIGAFSTQAGTTEIKAINYGVEDEGIYMGYKSFANKGATGNIYLPVTDDTWGRPIGILLRSTDGGSPGLFFGNNF